MRDDREKNTEFYHDIYEKCKNLNCNSPTVYGKQRRRNNETKHTSSSLLLTLLASNNLNAQSSRKDLQSKSISPRKQKVSSKSIAFKSESKNLGSAKQINMLDDKPKCKSRVETESAHKPKSSRKFKDEYYYSIDIEAHPRINIKKNRLKNSKIDINVFGELSISNKIIKANMMLKKIIKSQATKLQSKCLLNDNFMDDHGSKSVDKVKYSEKVINVKRVNSHLVCWCFP